MIKLTTLLLAVLTTTTVIGQSTYLHMQSEPGDPIGMGNSYEFDETTGTFEVYPNNHNGISLRYDGGTGQQFSIDVSPKEGDDLIIGPYPMATRYPFNSPVMPGFSATGFWRSCGASESYFEILDLGYSEYGAITKIVVEFEQHCGGLDNPALTGTYAFNTLGPPYPTAQDSDSDTIPDTLDNCNNTPNPEQTDTDKDSFGDACDPYFTNTNITLDSESGDFIGQGEYREFYLITGTIDAVRNWNNGVTIRYRGAESWDFNFSAPGNVELTEGEYLGATRWPFQEADEPGLDASGAGRGCNTLSGNFQVISAQYDSEGEVERFEANFEQHCEGMEPALFGIINYNKDPSDLIFANGFE